MNFKGFNQKQIGNNPNIFNVRGDIMIDSNDEIVLDPPNYIGIPALQTLYIKGSNGASSNVAVITDSSTGEQYTQIDIDGGSGTSMTSWNLSGDSGVTQTITDGNTVTLQGSNGITTVGQATDDCVIVLDNTGVTPGSYTNTDFTVDAQGRITLASSNTLSLEYYENFTFGLSFPFINKSLGPKLFQDTTKFWLVPGMDDALQGTMNLGVVNPSSLAVINTFTYGDTILNYQVSKTTPRSMAIAYKHLVCNKVSVHLTEIGRVRPGPAPTPIYNAAVKGWSQTIRLKIHAFCEVDNTGVPSGGDTFEFTIRGATDVPSEDTPAGLCSCIPIDPTLNIGCSPKGGRAKFLAIELMPEPGLPISPSWWPLGVPTGASYSIQSRTISVTVKGKSSDYSP